MVRRLALLFIFLGGVCSHKIKDHGKAPDKEVLTFPKGFMFGAASSAYQIEGSWNVSDKSESVWDRYTHTSGLVMDNGTGDIACDSYHLWKTDIANAKELGLHFYRFSLAWTRILPTGFTNYISEEGTKYYSDLIDGLLANGIQPLVTIYHWDLPMRIQNLGGWSNPLIADWYSEYARVVFDLYGDRVKYWLTLNEPEGFCDLGYGGTWAPAVNDPQIAAHECNKNIMIAHAKAYRIYHEEFKEMYHGKISMANHLIWYEPESPKYEKSTELMRELQGGCYSHPIYSKDGGWPPIAKKALALKSKRDGFSKSILPEFTKEEIELVKGTFDFYAMNYYTSRKVRKTEPGEVQGLWPFFGSPDFNLTFDKDKNWPSGSSIWLYVNPEGLRNELNWLKKRYGDIEILITENGLSTTGYELNDNDRINYYKEHLKQVWLAIKKDRIKVIGYTAWTLMDNFEWVEGYVSKFGLYEVNFEDPARKRTPKKSAKFFAKMISTNSIEMNK